MGNVWFYFQIKGTSDTSSELDFSQKAEPIKSNKPEIFNSSDSENSVPVQAPISNKNFAEQLAAKLGHVITQDFTEPEVNKRPIQPKSNYGNKFNCHLWQSVKSTRTAD